MKKKTHWKTIGGVVVIILLAVVGYATLRYQLSKPQPANNATTAAPVTVAATTFIPFTFRDIELQRPLDYGVRVNAKNDVGQILFEDNRAYVKVELFVSETSKKIENYIYKDLPPVRFETVAGNKAAVFVSKEGYADGPTHLTTKTPFVTYSFIHNGVAYDLQFNESTELIDERRLKMLESIKFVK